MNINPVGNISVTLVFTAVSGPLLVTVTVQVMTSPVFTICFETSLTTTKSALGSTSVVLLASLFVLFGSYTSLVTFTMLTKVLLVTLTKVVKVKVCDSPLAKDLMYQVMSFSSNIPLVFE